MENVARRDTPPGAVSARETPRNLVTICAECKQLIGPQGDPLGRPPADEGTLVSHGICAACARRLYGAIFNRRR